MTEVIDRRRRLVAGAALVALALAVALPSISSGFIVLDDRLYVVKNTRLEQSFWHQWNSADAWAGRFIEFFPLRDSIYWVLFHTFGLNALPFHLVGALAHVAATLASWRLATRLLGPSVAAWVGAALFAVHPVHVESISWVAGLKDPLSVTLMLGALIAYVDSQGPRQRWKYALSLVFLLAALLCKAIALMTPGLMVLVDSFSASPLPWKRRLQRVAVPTLLSAVFMYQFVGIARAQEVVLVGLHGGSLFQHAWLALWAQVRYVGLLVLPVTSQLTYCFEPISGWGDGRIWGALCFVGALLGALVAARRTFFPFVVGWHLLCLLPVSNLVPFPALLAERYVYASSVAVCWWFAMGLMRLPTRLRTTAVAVTVLTLLGVSAVQASRWNTPEQLFVEADEDPQCMTDTSNYSVKAHVQRALSATDSTTAIAAFDRATHSAGFASQMTKGQRCGFYLQTALRVLDVPHDARTDAFVAGLTEWCPAVASAWYMSAVYLLSVDPSRALQHAERSLQLEPNAVTLAVKAFAQFELGDAASASNSFTHARQLDARSSCQALKRWLRGRDRSLALPSELVNQCSMLP